MTFKIPHFIILSSIYLFAAGCQSYIPYQASTQFTPISQEPCLIKSSEVKLFLPSDKINFRYDQIGVVQLNINYDAHRQARIDYLKLEAWSKCADAIINVSPDFQYGIAVKIKKDAQYFAHYKDTVDLSFANFVGLDQTNIDSLNISNQQDEFASGSGFTAFLFITSIILIPFFIAGQPEQDI